MAKIAVARIHISFRCDVPSGEILKPGFNLRGRYAYRGLFDYQGILFGIHCDRVTTTFQVIDQNVDILKLYQESYARHGMEKHAFLAVRYMEKFLSPYPVEYVMYPKKR